MSFPTQRLAVVFSCVAALGGGSLMSSSQGQKPPSGDTAGKITSFPATSGAQFSSVPITTPSYPWNPYPNYNGVYGGFLSGAADVINSQGQFMVSQQQAYQMREQVRQAKIDTRRKNLDEYLYERAVMPTTEDERERARLENLRRSRNDPPITEIWSGKALNDLLLGIQQQFARNIQGPKVPLDPYVLERINVTGSQTGGSLGLIRDGRLTWPLAFRANEFNGARQQLDQLASKAYRQAQSGAVDGDTIQGMTAAVDSLAKQLKRNIDEISANDYIKAKRFLNDLTDAITVLQDPNASKYLTQKWTARGNTVGDLTRDMTSQGLKFAPAVTGDEAAYVALHRDLVQYFVPPDKPWDPAAK